MLSLKRYLKDNNIKNLLVVFPHPDDESYATGLLLLEAKKLGIKTNLVILTKGENGSSEYSKGDELSRVRTQELIQASNILKVDNIMIGDFKDAGIKEDIDRLKGYIQTQIDNIKPDLVVTYDHGGFTGHPDHIATSVTVLDICKSKKIPLLFYTPIGMNRVLNRNLAEKYNSTPGYIVHPKLSLNKVEAFFKHKSQITKFGIVYKLLLALFILISPEVYHLVDYTKVYSHKYFPFSIG